MWGGTFKSEYFYRQVSEELHQALPVRDREIKIINMAFENPPTMQMINDK